MKPRMYAFLFFGFLALPCGANDPAPRLTGERLLQYFSSEEALERAFADGYLAGIADATQGKSWCIAWEQKPHEIDADVFHALRKLPRERLREKASLLVIEALKGRFPCE
ncbi:MAG: hypothetical protein LBU11_06605 [Zoogloeaceae bacterium]|jgi:hypothetical protein|nr:hypothetical protein [Zoogloeaceae bacterium]